MDKARKIVSVATSETEAEWLEKARALSNRDLEKEVRRHDGRGSGQFATLTISMPVEILDMWNDAYELAERLSGTELEKWQVLEPSLAEFLGTHLPADGAGARETDDEKELPDKVRDAVLDRDGWKCKFPGCTMRKMLDVHHIEFRSHLGSEDLDNKISLCRIHHELIHRGICRVTGAVGVDLKFERPQLVAEQKPVRAEVVDEPPEEASNEELASPDGDESWRDEIVADIFDGPRPPKPEMPHKDYGDFIAHWVKQKRASDLEERAKTRRAGQARPGAHDGMDSSRDLIGIDVPRSAVGLRLSREQKGPSCHPARPNLGRLHYYELEHGAFGMTRLREFMRGLVDGGPTPSGRRTPAVIRGIGEPPAIGRKPGRPFVE